MINSLDFKKGILQAMQFSNWSIKYGDSFEQNKFTLGVFIDLSKAFDTVDHSILIKKLSYFGIKETNLEWFKS